MFKVMLVIKKLDHNPCYGMASIHKFNNRDEALTEADFLQEHLNIPFYVSVADQLENDDEYPYLTVAEEK